MRAFVKFVITYYRVWWVTVSLSIYIFICIFIPILVDCNSILYKSPHSWEELHSNTKYYEGNFKIISSLVSPPSVHETINKHITHLRTYSESTTAQERFNFCIITKTEIRNKTGEWRKRKRNRVISEPNCSHINTKNIKNYKHYCLCVCVAKHQPVECVQIMRWWSSNLRNWPPWT